MERMRRIAFQTALKACMFAALAIFCMMVGLSYDLRLAFQTGGTLTILLSVVLVYKAIEARTKSYKKTEMWLLIPKDERPPESYAQRVSSTLLRETYLTFALWSSAVAIAMWAIAFLISLSGLDVGAR